MAQMLYEQIEFIINNWNGKVCIFGAGKLGAGKVYELIKMSGITIDCFVDNYVKPETIIRDGIYVKSPDYLYEHAEDYYVVACFGSVLRSQIEAQLQDHDINHYCFISWNDIEFFSDELENAPYHIKQRYIEIYDDELFLMKQYAEKTGHNLNLNLPRSFNEKLQWMKLNYRVPQMIEYVDKRKAKELVKSKIGAKYIIQTIGEWSRFDEIDFRLLPEKYVLKCTHDSGSVAICKDKKTFDIDKTRAAFEKALKKNYYWQAREWQYKYVRPQIIAEEYIGDGVHDIKDYKIFCFDGVPRIIQVDIDRFKDHRRNLYTTDWQYIDGSILYPTDKNYIVEKPRELEEMLQVARVLSEGFLHVRVDLYDYEGKVYFGEMTFTHGAGYEKFEPSELGLMMGDYIKLPIDDRG